MAANGWEIVADEPLEKVAGTEWEVVEDTPEDSWGTAVQKSFENIPTRWKAQAGGMMRAAGEQEEQAVAEAAKAGEAMQERGLLGIGDAVSSAIKLAPTIPGLIARQLSPGLRETDKALRERGAKIHKEAAEELEQNRPVVEQGSAKYYVSQAIESGLGSMAPSYITAMVTRSPNIGLGLMGTQVYGETYGADRASGRPADVAHAHALFSAATESVTEKIPMEKILKPGSKLLRRVFSGTLSEAGQEMLNEAFQIGYEMGILDEKTDLKEAWNRIRDAGIIGGLMGGGMAVATHPFAKGSEGGWEPIEDLPPEARQSADRQPAQPPALPPPRILVTPEGVAGTEAQMQAEEARKAEIGLTRDVVAAQARRGIGPEAAATAQVQTPAAAGLTQPPAGPISRAASVIQPTQPAATPGTTLEQAAQPAAPLAAAPARVPFAQPYDVRLQQFRERARKANLTDEQIEALIPEDTRDTVTGFYRAEERVPTLRRAQEHIRQTGEPGVYIEFDISNLGGLNKARGHAGANKVYRRVAEIVKGELGSVPGVFVETRHGGDEFSAIGVGADVQMAEAAAERAQRRIAEYIKAEGLSEIPHTKEEARKLGIKGVGINFGVSEVLPEADLEDIFSKADQQVEKNKLLGGKDVIGTQTEAAGAVAPLREAGGIEKGTGGDAGPAGEVPQAEEAARATRAVEQEGLTERSPAPTEQPTETPAQAGVSVSGAGISSKPQEPFDAKAFMEESRAWQKRSDAAHERAEKLRDNPDVSAAIEAYENGDIELDEFERVIQKAEGNTIDAAAHQAATSPQNNLPQPTEAQKKAGNYAKGHVLLHGLDISIENPKGSERSGTDRTGKKWSVKMAHHYGYIKGTVGKDKDHIDVFLGPEAHNPRMPVFVVDQVDPETGAFDEHKVLMGFPAEGAARRGYLDNYTPGWKGLGAIKQFTLEEFKDWLKSGNTKRPVALGETTDASKVRSDEGRLQAPVHQAGTGPATRAQEGQDQGGADLQRDTQEGRAAGNEQAPVEERVIVKRTRKRRSMTVDPTRDTILVAIAKLGGLDRDEAKAQGIDPHYFRDRRGRAFVGIMPVFKRGGESFDGMAEALSQFGYMSDPYTANELLDKVEQALAGKEIYSNRVSDAILEQQARLRERELAQQEEGPVAEEDPFAFGEPMSAADLDNFFADTTLEEDQELQGSLAPADEASADLMRRAVDMLGRDRVDEILESVAKQTEGLSDDEYEKARTTALQDAIQAAVGQGQAQTEPRQDVAVTGLEHIPQEQGEDLTLTPTVAPRRTTAARPTATQPDLFGGKSATAQAIHDREVARKERERNAPEMNEGEGTLFNQNAQKQTDIEDVTGKQDAEKSKVTAKIEDFGETLQGARKHYAQAYQDRMREAGEVDIAAEPLSRSWPEPDYLKLLDEGVDPWTVAFIHAARDAIPTKPQKGWKLKGWVESVKALRGMSNDMLSGAITKERVQEALNDPKFARLKEEISERIDLYQAVGHEKSLKGISISAGRYSVFAGKEINPPRIIWTVEKKAKATSFSNWPTQLASGDTREEAIANFKERYGSLDLGQKAAQEVSFDIYSKRSDAKKVFYIGKKIGKDYIDLKSFDTVEEARQYKAEHHDELLKLLEKAKAIPNERRETNEPRVGVDHRNGADVTPEQFSETFGFRGVQFGNYVEGRRRQADLNNAYDALMDLAGVLGIPPRALSLNGELGLAFGARGTGGKNAPAAHYEPGTVVINLTKREGAGSLAHEWWHALDNYFSRMRGEKETYVTEFPRAKLPGDTSIRPEMLEAFRGIMQAVNSTSLKQRASKLDKRRTKAYWSTGREMAARAFESYIIAKLRDQGASNDYLANIVSQEYWDAAAALGLEMEGTYPYLEAAEIPVVRAAFDHFLNTVETRETDRGVAMFARRIHGDRLSAQDYVVPETPEFDGNMTGDLAYTPKSAEKVKDGIKQLPIRLTVGVARDIHRGYGIEHIRAEMDRNPSREAPQYTDDRAENVVRQVAAVARSFNEIYREGDKIILRSSRMNEALVVQERTDPKTGESFYSVVTLKPARRQVWGEPVWVERGETRSDRLRQSGGPEPPPDQVEPRSDRQSRGAQTSKYQFSPKSTGGQQSPKVTVKKRRVIKPSDVQFRRMITEAWPRAGLSAAEVVATLKERLPGLSSAIDRMLARGESGKKGGLILVESEEPAALALEFARRTGRPLTDATVHAIARSRDGEIQGFYDPATGLIFLSTPALNADTAPAVLLHEATHGQKRDALNKRALALMENRGGKLAHKSLREFLNRVATRMEEAGEAGTADEATAYIVELAAIEGRQAGFSAIDGRFMNWVDRAIGKPVGNLLREFVAMIRAWGLRFGLPLNPTVDDLLALAKGDVKRAAAGRVVQETEQGSEFSRRPASSRSASGVHQVQGLRNGRVAAVAVPLSNGNWEIYWGDGPSLLNSQRFRRERVASRVAAERALERAGLVINVPGRPGHAVQQAGIFPGFSVPDESRLDYLARFWQDRFRRVKVVQRAIQKQGGRVDETSDAYLAEELYYGRTEARLERFREEHVEPLIEAIKRAGVTIEEVDEYLYAKHAPERNARIAEINPYFRDNDIPGSGMSDQEAADILDRFSREGKAQKLEDIARRVYAINRARIDLLKDEGLESRETLDLWRNTYRYYVPLRGLAEEGEQRPRTGRGYDIRGRESRQAFGRGSRAESPLTYAIAQMEESIVRAEKNEVGKAFLKLVQANPNPDLWEVNKVHYKPRIDHNTGEVVYGPDPTYRHRDNVYSVKVDGEEMLITLHDDLLARALKNLGADQANVVVRALGTVNRFLAAMNTSLNPEFVLTNFARDLQTALINLYGEQGVSAHPHLHQPRGIARKVLKDVAPAMSGILLAERGEGALFGMIKNRQAAQRWSRAYEEYKAAGGKVGFFGLDTIENKRKRLERELRQASGGAVAKAEQAVRTVGEIVMDYNTAVENAVRLAAFKNARDLGLSTKAAASLAKNLTVNFNRKGELGVLMNSLYLFYNAGLQGSVRLLYAMRSKKVQALLGGIVIGAFLLAEMNRMAGGDDDDDEAYYDKLVRNEPWVIEHNLVIMLPGGDRITFPLPYGYNIPYVLGTYISHALHSDNPARSVVRMMIATAGAFNPLGSDSDLLQMISPTLIDPVAQIETNKNFAGAPIYPENRGFGPERPDSQRYFSTVSPLSKAITEQINELTGGSEIRPGVIDVSPETVDHLVSQFFGGTGAFVHRAINLVARAYEGEDITPKDIPFARRFINKPSEFSDTKDFRERVNEIKLAYEEVMQDYKRGRRDQAREKQRKYGGLLRLYELATDTERAMQDEWRLIHELRAHPRYTDEQKREREKKIKERMDKHIARFNRKYRERISQDEDEGGAMDIAKVNIR